MESILPNSLWDTFRAYHPLLTIIDPQQNEAYLRTLLLKVKEGGVLPMWELADRTQSRWGTYRPWLIFGAVPLGLVFALLLYTPEIGPVGKRIYAYTL